MVSRRFWIAIATLVAGYAVVIIATALFIPFRTANSNTAAYFREENFFLHFDPKWGLMNRPNHSFRRTLVALNGDQHSFDIHYDDIGARVDAPGMRSGRANAIVNCGDSSSSGFGVQNPDTYTSQLGRLTGLPVANLALASFGATGVFCLRTFQRAAETLQPRALVYYFLQSHFRSNTERCGSWYDIPLCVPLDHVERDAGGALRAVSLPAAEREQAMRRNFRLWRETLPHRDTDATFWSDLYWTHHLLWSFASRRVVALAQKVAGEDARPIEPLEAAQFVLDEMLAVARKAGACLVVVYEPARAGNQIQPTPPQLAEFAKQRGIELVSLELPFRELLARNADYAYLNQLSPLGHRVVAEAIHQAGCRPVP